MLLVNTNKNSINLQKHLCENTNATIRMCVNSVVGVNVGVGVNSVVMQGGVV